MKDNEKKLKPVTFIKGEYRQYYAPNDYQQRLLLKAMTITSDPKEWRKMLGVKSVADVYRTLDKLALRKEYHEALVRLGIDFDFIVSGIKDISTDGKSDGVKLKAFETLLKSVGMDKYDDVKESAKDWEELITEVEAKKELAGEKKEIIDGEDYIVDFPEVPKDAQKKIDADKEVGKSLYD